MINTESTNLWVVNHWGKRWTIASLNDGWFDTLIGKVRSCRAFPLDNLEHSTCTRQTEEKVYKGKITGLGLRSTNFVGVFWLGGQDKIPFYFWNDINNLKINNLIMAENTSEEILETLKGTFVDNLKRNNKQIRADRAVAIAEDAQMIFKREVEDMELTLRKLKRDRENALDLSPADTHSLKLASDFDAKDWAAKDLELGVKIWNLDVKLKLAKERYKLLFNQEEPSTTKQTE